MLPLLVLPAAVAATQKERSVVAKCSSFGGSNRNR